MLTDGLEEFNKELDEIIASLEALKTLPAHIQSIDVAQRAYHRLMPKLRLAVQKYYHTLSRYNEIMARQNEPKYVELLRKLNEDCPQDREEQ